MDTSICLDNIYLKETPLTSTKNKYLLHSTGYSEEFYLNFPSLKGMKRKLEGSTLLASTENKILKQYNPTVVKKQRLKKKKKECPMYCPASSSTSLPLEEDFREAIPRSRHLRKTKLRCALRKSCPASSYPAPDLERDLERSIDSSEHEDLCSDVFSTQALLDSVPPGEIFGSSACSVPEPPLCFGGIPLPNFNIPQPQIASVAALLKPPKIASVAALQQSGFALRAPPRRSFVFGSSPAGFPPLQCNIPKMPEYNFESLKQPEKENFSFERKDDESDLIRIERIQNLKSKKMKFLNAASMALICSSNLKESDDAYRIFIQKCADDVRVIDPEFILKVALYSRQELHIRSATNFLLSYASYHEETRPYVGKYFESCIQLPSDWIEVANLYQIFHDKRLKNGSLPAALKKVMAKSFHKFDAYQLAKYNRGKTKNQKIKEKLFHALPETCTEDSEQIRDFSYHGYTLKQLIRLLHLNSPSNEIMCLLGKKYPVTAEAFRKSGLTGLWDPKQAGKRMKLQQPETWETQISAHGNKASVWERLIDNNKLPYMAMLRNVRNLMLSGISPKHHEKVLQHLENRNAVMKSKQTPIQFYEAFKTVTELDKMMKRNMDDEDETETEKNVPFWQKNRKLKASEKMNNVSECLVNSYQNAINKAVEISALYNLQPIPGKSLVICDIFLPRGSEIKMKEKALLLSIITALMCLKACEDCEMTLICGHFSKNIIYDEKCTFMEILMNISSELVEDIKYTSYPSSVTALKNTLEFRLKPQTLLKEKLDHVIYLRISGEYGNSEIKDAMSSFLHKYRQIVNKDLLYTAVDFGQNASFSETETVDGKDVHLCGNSTQLIKFIAERSSGSLLTYIENMDTKYNLKNDIDSNKYNLFHSKLSEEDIVPIYSRAPKWHTVKIFISSTFKDMHSERDVIIRYVIPELRRRAASIFVKINEVDLRWGITETDCATKRAAELCLMEAQKSDLFIGLLGERYGSIYNFDPPDSPDLKWVKDYPSGLSITELEMHAGALRERKNRKNKAFFYFRNNVFMGAVPPQWKNHFDSENEESKQKVEDLKSKISSSGFKVLNGYSCHFAGIFKDKPILGGLDEFGKTMLNDLWHAVEIEEDLGIDDVEEEEICQQHLLDSFDDFVEGKNLVMESLVTEIKKSCGMFLVTGTPGSGKTTFVVNLLKKLGSFSVIKFFVGLTPRSTDVTYMLQYISKVIAKNYPVSSVFPKVTKDVVNQFPDILHEAVKCCGNNSIILLIDGLDHLEVDDQMMDWLPLNLPHGLRLIFTASDSSYAFKMLHERQMHGNVIHIENLVPMIHSDRECFVKHYLKLYGKVLDESPFNNQMLALVTKKDSGIPLYLRISCDFLRTYASFDNFMSMLQSMPSTMPLVLEEIILQMENEFTSTLVQTTLTLLCITKEGLDDTDLRLLLSFVTLQKEKYISFKDIGKEIRKLCLDDLLSQVTYCSLVHTICTFAYGHNRFTRYNLCGSEFEKAVKKFYLNKNHSNFTKYMHSCLAAYYFTQCDPKENGTFNSHSASAFRATIYHMYHGQCYKDLAENLSCLKFLESVFRVEAADSLLEYYVLLTDISKLSNKEVTKEIDFHTLSSFHDFILKNQHIFQDFPNLVMQQALNEPSDSLVKAKLDCESIKSNMVECLSQHSPDSRLVTIGGFIKNITAAVCEEEEPLALLGSEDGCLKVLDLTSKRIIRSLKGHTSTITAICCAGNNRICTASADTTLSIWSSIDYTRIFVLEGHKHYVSCCCADSSNNILLSSGWDHSVRLWSLRDGRIISVIDDFGCPVNCLDHHPMKQQVACGLWNGNIEIWDTVSLNKMLVLENQCGSVKSVTYAPDGINIIASYMNSNIVIWSSEEGLKITSLKGHILPVKSISYSYGEDMIISGSDDSTLKVWPTESRYTVCTLSECKFCPISMLEIISPNCIAISFQNSDIWVMDINNGHVISKITLLSEIVSCFSKLSFVDCSSHDDLENWADVSFVFGTKSGKVMIGELLTSSTKTVGSLNSMITAIVHNESVIICGNSNGDIGVFTLCNNSNTVLSGAHGGSVSSLNLKVKDDELWLLSSGNDKMICLWLVDKERPTMTFNSGYISTHSDHITCCHWISHFDDKGDLMFLTGSHDNNVILHDGFSETKLQGLKTTVVKVDFAANYIIGCGSDGSVAIWSKNGNLLSNVFGIQRSSAILSFHIDRDVTDELDITLAFTDLDGSVKIRKPVQRSFCYSLEGHCKSVTSCCANPNGEILSSSLDGTVNLWKVPLNFEDMQLHHSASVTDIIISTCGNIALSSDAHGNIILWKLNFSSTISSLTCVAKKTYTSGYIKALTWLQNKKFVSAVSQIIDHEEKHFLDVISFECLASDENDVYNFQVKTSYSCESEILCLDANPESDMIVAGLKTGNFVIITGNTKRIIKTSEDWILGTQILQNKDSVENLFLSLLKGSVKRFETAKILQYGDISKVSFQEFPPADIADVSSYNSAFCCENEEKVFCGNTEGYLKLYTKKTKSTKKVHDDSITGISVVGPYVFTCSLDRTVKGFNSTTLRQVCQFHSSVSVTSITAQESILHDSSDPSYILMIGTVSGTVHLLKYYPA